MRGHPLLLLVAAWIATAQPAGAAPAPQDVALAEAVFREAKELIDAGDVAEACPKFEESLRLDPRPGTLLYVATCHEEQGKLATAWAEYTEAASQLSDQDDERATIAKERAQALEPRLPHVVIDVREPGIAVTLDGRTIGQAALGTPLPVDAGDHAVRATAPGKLAHEQTIRLTPEHAATPLQVTIPALVPAGKRPPPPPPPKPQPAPVDEEAGPGGMLITGGVLTGVGAAGVALGAVFGGLAIGHKNDGVAACTDPGGGLPLQCTAEGEDALVAAEDTALVSTIAMIGGAAVMAVGVTLILVDLPSTESSSTSQARVTFEARWARGRTLAEIGVDF